MLGLLSLQPMSAYEIVQGYGRSIGQIVSRSEAAIYNEPKKLARDGLVTNTDENRGRRVVAIYDITPAGREELARWLEESSVFPQVDAEPILRVVFADPRDIAQLRANITAFRDETLERSAAVQPILDEYVEGAGRYPERSPLVALSGRFIVDLHEAYLRWCDWALDALDQWESDDDAPTGWALATFHEMIASLPHRAHGPT